MLPQSNFNVEHPSLLPLATPAAPAAPTNAYVPTATPVPTDHQSDVLTKLIRDPSRWSSRLTVENLPNSIEQQVKAKTRTRPDEFDLWDTYGPPAGGTVENYRQKVSEKKPVLTAALEEPQDKKLVLEELQKVCTDLKTNMEELQASLSRIPDQDQFAYQAVITQM